VAHVFVAVTILEDAFASAFALHIVAFIHVAVLELVNALSMLRSSHGLILLIIYLLSINEH
jgi:hypothetical protein